MLKKKKVNYKNLIDFFLRSADSEIIAKKLVVTGFALKHFNPKLLALSGQELLSKFGFEHLKFWDPSFESVIHELEENPNQTYENLLLKSPNQTGSFFTPAKLAKRLALSVYNPELHNLILDPSCGTGIFLQEILLSSDIPEITIQKIRGFDINTDSLEFCKFFLNLILDSKNVKIINLDAQLIAQDGLLAIDHNKYDLIIGNPPYGISRGNQISKVQLETYARLFPEIAQDKLNKYILFTYKYFQHLNQSGKLAFIIPNAWLGIKSSKAFRTFLAQNKAIEKIEVLGKEFNASVETVFLVLNKEKKESFEILNNHRTRKVNFKTNNNFKIGIHKSKESDKILDLLSGCIEHIKNHFQPYIAIQPYALGKGEPKQTQEMVDNQVYHSDTKLDPSYLPYLDGKDIKRYQYNSPKKFIKYGTNLSEYQPIDRFEKPRILIREIVNKLPYVTNACYCDQVIIYNKSVLHIQGESIKLQALLKILNSKFGGLILYLIGNKIQRRIFPKLVIDDLKNFPLPNQFNEKINFINSAPDNKIDSMIAQVYGISEDLIEQAIYEELNF